MDLIRLMNDLNDDTKYRFHLAKTEPEGGRPLDALVKSENDWLNWQVYKGKKRARFANAKFVVSFAQINGNKFLFGGIFEILDRTGNSYDVEYTKEYGDMIGRLIIEYQGNNKKSTVFKPSYIYSHSRISGIYEYRFKGEPFRSYDEINHDFHAMEIIVKNELSDWKVALSSISGIYLISDKATGKHYVGSAHGEDGIWGRWNSYIYGFHGNNVDLVKLFKKKNEEYFRKNFKFAILEVMSSARTLDEVRKRESLWKCKLSSREFGYNQN